MCEGSAAVQSGLTAVADFLFLGVLSVLVLVLAVLLRFRHHLH